MAPTIKDNPRGLLCAKDELSAWFGSFDRYSKGQTNSDAANWLRLHRAGGLTVNRKSSLIKVLHVPRAVVAVTGGIQPEILKKALSPEHRESGLAARPLFASPPRWKRTWNEEDVSEASIEEHRRTTERLLSLEFGESIDGEEKPIELSMTPEAKKLWVEFYNLHNDEHTELSGDLSAAWSKLEELPAIIRVKLSF